MTRNSDKVTWIGNIYPSVYAWWFIPNPIYGSGYEFIENHSRHTEGRAYGDQQVNWRLLHSGESLVCYHRAKGMGNHDAWRVLTELSRDRFPRSCATVREIQVPVHLGSESRDKHVNGRRSRPNLVAIQSAACRTGTPKRP